MICAHCHHDFTPRRKHQKYCRDACRVEAFRVRQSAEDTIRAQAARIAELEEQLRARGIEPGNGQENAF